MNTKGQKGIYGFALLMVLFVLVIVSFTTIEPMKENLDDSRGTSSLNCKGTIGFNQTAYDLDNDNKIAKLTKRPTCFVTGLSMVWFIGAFIIGAFGWLIKNWRKIA
jgi:uncharacterized membrane-anchored protein